MRLQAFFLVMLCAIAVGVGCRFRASERSAQASDEEPRYGLEKRFHEFAARIEGRYIGEFVSGLIFKERLKLDLEIKKLSAEDSHSRILSMRITVKGRFDCEANALLSLDNDAYPVSGENSATVEMATPYRINSGSCPFIAVLAVPEMINVQESAASLALTLTNDLGSRKMYRGILRQISAEDR